MSQESFDALNKEFGPWEVDWFASDWSRRLEKFSSRYWTIGGGAPDAFSQRWDQDAEYFHPPLPELARVLEKDGVGRTIMRYDDNPVNCEVRLSMIRNDNHKEEVSKLRKTSSTSGMMDKDGEYGRRVCDEEEMMMRKGMMKEDNEDEKMRCYEVKLSDNDNDPQKASQLRKTSPTSGMININININVDVSHDDDDHVSNDDEVKRENDDKGTTVVCMKDSEEADMMGNGQNEDAEVGAGSSTMKQTQIFDYYLNLSNGQGSKQMGECKQPKGTTLHKPQPNRKPWATKKIRKGKPLNPKGEDRNQLTLEQTLLRTERIRKHQLVTDTRDNQT